MNVAEGIAAELARRDPLPVREVCIGRKYTAVALEDGSVGVALTQLPQHLGCCDAQVLSSSDRRDADALLREAAVRVADRRSTTDLLPLMSSPDTLLGAVALACANAMVNRGDVEAVGGDTLECLGLRSSDVVAMIGFFGPLLPGLRSAVQTLHIFERRGGNGLLPADEAPCILPSCDVALITAGTINNGTLDELLQAAVSCREVVLLGASTPLLPSAFRSTPVTWLSGCVVGDGPRTLRVVADGGGRREFGPFVKKLNLHCR